MILDNFLDLHGHNKLQFFLVPVTNFKKTQASKVLRAGPALPGEVLQGFSKQQHYTNP